MTKLSLPNSIYLPTVFIIFLVINAFITLSTSAYFPQQVVLGTMSMDSWWAAAHSGGVLAIINLFVLFAVSGLFNKGGRSLSIPTWVASFFVSNLAAIWLITRAADQFGWGVSSWVVVLLLAVVFAVFHSVAVWQIEPKSWEN